MLHDDVGFLGNTLYTVWRAIGFVSCVTAICWVVAGFVTTENFVLIDNAPAALHASKLQLLKPDKRSSDCIVCDAVLF